VVQHRCRLFVAVLLACAGSWAALRAQVDEHRLKAVVLGKFPQFVSWPAEEVATRQSFELCILRPHRFGAWLNEISADLVIEGRPVVVREIAGASEVPACQLIFFPAGTGGSALRRAATLPILTVGEHQAFLDQGGIVRLRLAGRQLRFDINAAQADRVGLRLSSQLLRLADHVSGGRP
jgi:hypothetical protein